jgi:CheY-like chemotaxis protein
MTSPVQVGRPEERRRVVVVDNDPVMRAGTAAVLHSAPEIDVVAAVDHAKALSWREEWTGIDVAVVDASDGRRSGDQFPGVAVVTSIRSLQVPVTVVVLTGQYLHPGLRHRMWEAGADFFYPRDEGMTEEELVSVVVSPDDHRRLHRPPGSLPPGIGITPATRVNEIVDRLAAEDLDSVLHADARKKTGPHGERSRWWSRVRVLASGRHGLTPVNATGNPSAHLEAPSIVQLRKFWSAVARIERPRKE